MNAAAMDTETSSDEGRPPDPDSPGEAWLEPAGEWDDEASDEAEGAKTQGSLSITGASAGLAAGASEPQLAEWIDAIVDQDERALAALYDATFLRTFGLVQRIVRRTALAEEVVEDTYFQVWRQAVRFDPARGQALTWLLSIARSRAIDALRREARFKHDSIDEDNDLDGTADLRPHDELLDVARHSAGLQQALLQLGAQPRQLVSLAFFRGLSHEEIAQQTHLPLGTVKSQIRRALLTLRDLLAAGGFTALAS